MIILFDSVIYPLLMMAWLKKARGAAFQIKR
jgi:hypothetical protein